MEVIESLLSHPAIQPVAFVLAGALSLVVLVKAVSHVRARRRSQLLKAEYDQVVAEQVAAGRRADAEPESVVLPPATKAMRPLQPADRKRYADEWAAVQEEFVDTPAAAIVAADKLIVDVLRTRGYPVSDPTRIGDVVAQYHPRAAVSFRATHALAREGRLNSATTDYLRQSFLHQRALFQELVDNVAHIDLTAAEVRPRGSYHRWFRGVDNQ